MRKLSNNELKKIYGGASISGTLINALTSTFKMIHDIGRSLGGALRRIHEGALCKL